MHPQFPLKNHPKGPQKSSQSFFACTVSSRGAAGKKRCRLFTCTKRNIEYRSRWPWVKIPYPLHLPQNGTTGFDPQPNKKLYKRTPGKAVWRYLHAFTSLTPQKLLALASLGQFLSFHKDGAGECKRLRMESWPKRCKIRQKQH